MLRRLPAIAAAFAALLHLPAHSRGPETERWVAVEESDEGTMFFDRESAARTGAIVRFRMRFVRAAPDWRGERSMLIDSEIDCAGQTSTIRFVRAFGVEGELRRTINPGRSTRPDPIFAGSDRDALYRLACPGGRHLPSPPPTEIIAAPSD